jgi:hypothetical protein
MTHSLHSPLVCHAFVMFTAILCPLANGSEIYDNSFNDPPGTSYPEWTSSRVLYKSEADPPGAGEVEPSKVTNCASPNGMQRFLGEFGGPKFGVAGDPGYNRTQVKQTVRLALDKLPPHQALRISFDLYILKSWDGNSPQYGPDELRVALANGPLLIDSSFSNNHKVDRQGSHQDYPAKKSKPQSAAASVNTLGYQFFGDSIYRFEFTVPHDRGTLELDFSSQLFEGKGTDDESWGIDNIRVETAEASSNTTSSTPIAD